MKRQPSRVPSPTPTAFSGISNYRNESYRPSKDLKGAPAVPTIDYRQVSKVHFTELASYLAAYLAKAAPNSRSTARSKLTRLTIQQFHELSTDVYDELIRRKNTQSVPFLPVREEFHPKRNQARQKLATLPTSRFEDLSSDVYFELARRYPEFKEDPTGRTSPTYDDYPAPDFPSNAPQTLPRNNSVSRDRGPVEGSFGTSVPSRRLPEDRRRPSETDFGSVGRRSEDNYRRSDDQYNRPMVGDEGFSAALASRRKPSQDITRRPEDRERGDFIRRPSAATSVASEAGAPSQSTTAASGMIIPNKSTMEEEYIEVPYGREGRDSAATLGDDRNREPADDVPDSASDYPRSPPAGLSGLNARLKAAEEEDDLAIGNRSGDDLYDKYGRSSVDSSRSIGAGASRLVGARSATAEDQDKIKRDYEYKIATMQTQITNLQRDANEAAEQSRKRQEAENRVRQLEDELATVRQRADEQGSEIRSLQRELDDLRQARLQDARRAEEDQDELRIYRDRCMKLEEEREMHQAQNDPEIMAQLQADMEGLLTEISELSRRNDDLMVSKDSDTMLIRDLDNQLKEYKRKYEQAKTELRSVKATSQLFLQAPKFDKADEQLPVSSDGGVLDIHITAFLSAVDSLLTAGRSSAPTRVLTPMKAIVTAVTNIVDEVKAFERRAPRDIDLEALKIQRERAEATLTNLVAATKTHATSSGLSPVSLLDAAASHVSATITEIARMVCIRKATKAEQDQFAYNTNIAASGSAVNGFSPSLRSVEESRPGHQRKGSQTSTSSRGVGRFTDSPTSPPPASRNYGRRPPSENSSSEQTNSPPPIFDQGHPNHSNGVVSDDSAQADGSEDAWAELKPYLEAQTESIVCAIQAVLSGVRSPTPSPTLNENLTQIITIVSSIVAVCNDNLPPASIQQGNEILRELSDHANKLSEVQALPEITKESRQIMAKSSFAIANAMKGLMKL